MSNFLIILFTCFSLFFIPPPPNNSYYSLNNGNWNESSTWSGGSVPPNNGPTVYVNNDVLLNTTIEGMSISISQNSSLSTTLPATSGHYDLEIKSGDTLIVDGILSVFDLTFANGSSVYIGSTGSLKVYGDFYNKNNSDHINVNGSIDIDGDFYNGNGGAILGAGSIHADGNFTGTGSTFGHDNSTFPPNSTVIGTSLPVELLYFHALNQSDVITLSWATTSETNNSFFTIEHSSNGVSFDVLESVSGAGNSNFLTEYSVTDNEPVMGTNYYRLKQTDFDGNYKYIGFGTATLKQNEETLNAFIQCYPNPFNSKTTLQFISPENSNVKVDIFNISGKCIQTLFNAIVQKNQPYQIEFDGSMIPSGIYFYKVITESKIFKGKLVLNKY